MSYEAIGIAAGVDDKAVGNAVYNAMTPRQLNISYKLADYVLNQTFNVTRPRERVFNALDQLGLPREATVPLKGVIDQFIAMNERTQPAPEPERPVFAPQPDLARELQAAVDEMALVVSTLDPADIARTPAASLAKRLDRLNALLASSAPTPSQASAPATVAAGEPVADKTESPAELPRRTRQSSSHPPPISD